MNNILPESVGAFVAVQVSGKLEEGDYQQIIPLLKARIAEYGKISLFWEMIDFHGWKLGGLWADIKFDIKHANDFTRVAIVGEKKTHDMMATVMKPFTSSEVRYFETAKRDEALEWAQRS